jgi:ribosomal protein S18 acetylase RimI-like enzyme
MSITIQNIRDYCKKDIIEKVSFLICTGFESKFTKKLFSEKEVLKVVNAFCNYIYTEKGESLYVAEYNDEVCGCLFLTTNNDKYRNLYSSLSDFLSFSQRLKLLLLLGLLSHKPKPNERYIDFITVSSGFRNKGVGRALLSHCTNTFNNERLTLYVAKDNTIAYELYKYLDFKVVKKSSSLLMGTMTGMKGWYMMEWKK